MQNRIQITQVQPQIDGGRYAAKGVNNRQIPVSAVCFREGHDLVAASVRFRAINEHDWRITPLSAQTFDRFTATITPDSLGAWEFEIVAWTDHWRSWCDGMRKKVDAFVPDLDVDFADGAQILNEHIALAEDDPSAQAQLHALATALTDPTYPYADRIKAAEDPRIDALIRAHPWMPDASFSGALPLWIDRKRAAFSTWYEFFPRSIGSDGFTSGTFAQAESALPRIAEMGFDVVYLPPIHPIGITNRKGPNNSLIAGPNDPGVPWAIGSDEGGHMAVHPALGTLDDFDHFVQAVKDLGMEVALDFAIQCSPDHPWVKEHPEWFRIKSDGSIAYAENPPKKYQDIYPIDFSTPDQEGLWNALYEVVMFWIGHDIAIFRVDNPHTKALNFWEWLIDKVHQTNPDVIFLAEAFTRPVMMHQLAKLGFTQSYTYFAWRRHKQEMIDYVVELVTETADFLRPNFWPNTPDILTDQLQSGSRAMFEIRWALAALLSPNAGMYSGYELLEHTAVALGSEEYKDSEKYQFKPRDFNKAHSIAPWIKLVNGWRHTYPHFQHLTNVWFHGADHDDVLVFSKHDPNGGDPLLAVIHMGANEPINTWVHLDLQRLGLPEQASYKVRDLVSGNTWFWHGAHNPVSLNPWNGAPMHLFDLSQKVD
ncbi:alpha-1,4-glucan--maltose-1-phosphate maltosyltransferase [Stomatohabitans albus]|uniref:alpha-1,4-glucan--maltose-1-phosphate maltosyltransferase n=1 Tax=Stomatohabitans albus TaxID=3110766 RepID=UPI00300D60F9